ncbi:MAG: transcriptional regulator [Kordiimonadales bacterium]|nr:MAG: transcriptional regulator [Kordiimonadales bacterium]
MAALDLMGRRWALRIVWELRGGPLGFRALQAKCDGMSPTVLNTRIKELSAAQVIEQRSDRNWSLTQAGNAFLNAIAPLSDWADMWARQLEDHPPTE